MPVEPRAPEVLLIGTSLTAGYGLRPDQAWPTLIQQRIDAADLHFRVVNAGVSGETSSDARGRMDWLLAHRSPAVVMVETGANDALRGQPACLVRDNLEAILNAIDSLSPRPAVIVAGMEALPNMGRRYRAEFRDVFPAAASSHHAVYLQFLLAGVAGIDSLNQADGLHPNAAGSRVVADNVWAVLQPILDSLQSNAVPPPGQEGTAIHGGL